ncbi:MAG TPA: DUF4838 domain-containing protein [Chitinophagaceae bacterium]
MKTKYNTMVSCLKMSTKWIALIAITAFTAALPLDLIAGKVPPASVTLVKNGQALLTVLVDPALLPLDKKEVVTGNSERGEESFDPISEQRKAVRELIQYVKEISGAELKVEAAKKGATGCYVGLASNFPWLKKDLKELGDEGFQIISENKNICLLAYKPLGVRHAVSSLLMEQGVRWFFPGKVWEEVPKKTTIEVASSKQIPTYNLGRTVWYGYSSYAQPLKDQADWNYHNRMGSAAPVSIGHTGYGIDPEKDFATHPEWFALVKGQRKTSKVCYSNPEVIQQMIKYAMNQAANGATSVSLTPADGLGYCECDKCFGVAKGGEVKELKGSFFATRPDGVLVCTISETLFNAVNKVAKAVGEKYPNVMLGCYGYSAYSHPPSFKLEPNVFVQTTTEYRRTPLSLEDQIDMWGKRASHVGIRGYWSVYQWDWDNPKVGKFIPEEVQKDLQFYNKHNAAAYNTEACDNWAPRGLTYYVGSQLLWNVNSDVKTIIKDFYEKAFGPAATAMQRYYIRWYGPSVSVLNSSSANGNNDNMKIGLDELADYNPKSSMASRAALTAAFKDLDEAAKLVANQPKYQQRIDQMRMYAYYLLLRNKVWEAAAAKDNAAIIEAIKNETMFGARLTNTNMIHTKPLLGKGFMRLFKDYEPLLKNIPESQESEKGWRKPGEVPTHAELEQLWSEGKKYLGV